MAQHQYDPFTLPTIFGAVTLHAGLLLWYGWPLMTTAVMLRRTDPQLFLLPPPTPDRSEAVGSPMDF